MESYDKKSAPEKGAAMRGLFALTDVQRRAWMALKEAFAECDLANLSFILTDSGTKLTPFNAEGIEIYLNGDCIPELEGIGTLYGSQAEAWGQDHIDTDIWELGIDDYEGIDIYREERHGRHTDDK